MPGPHDFAVRLQVRSSFALEASTASRLASVTIASRPFVRRDDGKYRFDLGWRQSGKFFPPGLDSPNQLELVEQIRFCAHSQEVARRLKHDEVRLIRSGVEGVTSPLAGEVGSHRRCDPGEVFSSHLGLLALSMRPNTLYAASCTKWHRYCSYRGRLRPSSFLRYQRLRRCLRISCRRTISRCPNSSAN